MDHPPNETNPPEADAAPRPDRRATLDKLRTIAVYTPPALFALLNLSAARADESGPIGPGF